LAGICASSVSDNFPPLRKGEKLERSNRQQKNMIRNSCLDGPYKLTLFACRALTAVAMRK
jgi:hypothetical protein